MGTNQAEEEIMHPSDENRDSGEEDMIDFWNAQPATEPIKESTQIAEGPLQIQRIEDISAEATKLPAGIEWCTIDPENGDEMNDLWGLLNGQYVEDDESVFRFNYSTVVLKWALTPPGWNSEWHIGIRSSTTHKLLAFISAIPKSLRVRENVLPVFEFNFLCIDRELRGKRLTPILITEVTRRCNRENIWHAFHTGGVMLPQSVGVCRYFHRSLNFRTLYDVGFSPSKNVENSVRKYAIPDFPQLVGLREMRKSDVDQVLELWARYAKRYDLVLQFDKDEIEHWLVSKEQDDQKRVLWCYVVEDGNKKITDFFSFYCVEHSVLDPEIQTRTFRVGYLFYYATETGCEDPLDKEALKGRLNILMSDALILAKRAKLDVLNASSIMENALFVKEQMFGRGDGQLYYYVSNYNVHPVAGGMNDDDELDVDSLSGIGVTML